MKPKDLKEFPLNLNLENYDNEQLEKALTFFKTEENVTAVALEGLSNVTEKVLRKIILTINVTTSDSNETQIELDGDLVSFKNKSFEILKKVVRNSCLIQLQEISLKSLISFLPLEALFNNPTEIPFNSFTEIIQSVICSEHNGPALINILSEILNYQDTRSIFLKSLQLVCCVKIKNLASHHVENIVCLLNSYFKAPEEPNKTFCGTNVKSEKKKHGILVRKIWNQLITVNLDKEVKQLLLVCLIENLMGIIENPISLTDYFMATLNEGGAISLISLQGLFTLIQKFNINYPNVYHKLYNMFDTEIFNLPYKGRFYFLSDVFLSSLYLPQDMVGAFVKRISRLCLTAPPEDIVILSAFITNLLIRHPSLSQLINSNKELTLSSDPYDFTEKDPYKCRANESSLWELKLLQNHVLPNVSSAAMFISQPLPSVEKDLSTLIELNSSQIFVRETKKKVPEPPLTFEKPYSLVSTDSPFSNWNLLS